MRDASSSSPSRGGMSSVLAASAVDSVVGTTSSSSIPVTNTDQYDTSVTARAKQELKLNETFCRGSTDPELMRILNNLTIRHKTLSSSFTSVCFRLSTSAFSEHDARKLTWSALITDPTINSSTPHFLYSLVRFLVGCLLRHHNNKTTIQYRHYVNGYQDDIFFNDALT